MTKGPFRPQNFASKSIQISIDCDNKPRIQIPSVLVCHIELTGPDIHAFGQWLRSDHGKIHLEDLQALEVFQRGNPFALARRPKFPFWRDEEWRGKHNVDLTQSWNGEEGFPKYVITFVDVRCLIIHSHGADSVDAAGKDGLEEVPQAVGVFEVKTI